MSSVEQAVHVPAGAGQAVWVVGDTYTFKATAQSTGGAMTLFEASVPPGAGPPPHVHEREEEAYYVLSGELEVLDGERTFVARAGDFVFIPRGVLHCFKNVGTDAARMLIFFTPAGFDGFLLGVGLPARAGEQAPPLGPEELERFAELAPRYGVVFHT